MTDQQWANTMTDKQWDKLIKWLQANDYVIKVPKKGPPEIYKKVKNDVNSRSV